MCIRDSVPCAADPSLCGIPLIIPISSKKDSPIQPKYKNDWGALSVIMTKAAPAHPKACRGRFLLFDGDAGSAGRIAANGQSWAEG